MAITLSKDNDGAIPGAAYVHGELVKLAHEFKGRPLGRFYGSATAYFMTKDIEEILVGASSTFPADAVKATEPPTPTGFMWFEWKLAVPDGVTRGLGWSKAPDGDLMVYPFGHYPAVGNDRGVIFNDATSVSFEGGESYGAPEELRFLASAWEFMGQRLAAVETQPSARLAREVRRRLKLEDIAPPLVRVIQLRARDVAHGTYNHGDREYHHRWIVRGHWRQQWYPSLGSNRPKWINPYVKGPDGAPLLVAPVNIFAVAR